MDLVRLVADGVVGVLISGGNLIKKVLFPAEILPIVTVTANMMHFFLALPILVDLPDRFTGRR